MKPILQKLTVNHFYDVSRLEVNFDSDFTIIAGFPTYDTGSPFETLLYSLYLLSHATTSFDTASLINIAGDVNIRDLFIYNETSPVTQPCRITAQWFDGTTDLSFILSGKHVAGTYYELLHKPQGGQANIITGGYVTSKESDSNYTGYGSNVFILSPSVDSLRSSHGFFDMQHLAFKNTLLGLLRVMQCYIRQGLYHWRWLRYAMKASACRIYDFIWPDNEPKFILLFEDDKSQFEVKKPLSAVPLTFLYLVAFHAFVDYVKIQIELSGKPCILLIDRPFRFMPITKRALDIVIDKLYNLKRCQRILTLSVSLDWFEMIWRNSVSGDMRQNIQIVGFGNDSITGWYETEALPDWILG